MGPPSLLPSYPCFSLSLSLSLLLLLLPFSFCFHNFAPQLQHTHEIPSYRPSRALVRLDLDRGDNQGKEGEEKGKVAFLYVVSSFYDTRPLLFLRSPEVVFNIAIGPNLKKYASGLGCVVGRRRKGAQEEDGMELVFSGPVKSTPTRSNFDSALMACSVPHDMHTSLFSSLDYDYFGTIVGTGGKGGGKEFEETWIEITLLPNHPHAPLSLTTPPHFSSSAESNLHHERVLGVREYMDMYVKPYGGGGREETEKESEREDRQQEEQHHHRHHHQEHQQPKQKDQQEESFERKLGELNLPHLSPPHHHSPHHSNLHHQSIAICTSPMITGISSYKQKLPMFVEYYKMMGANYFYFYDNEVNDRFTPQYLSLYESQQIAEVITFHNPSALPTNIYHYSSLYGWWEHFPDRYSLSRPTALLFQDMSGVFKRRGGAGLKKGVGEGLGEEEGGEKMIRGLSDVAPRRVHYRGQMLALHDCLTRTIGKFRWVFFIDLDEYITINWDRASPYLSPLPLSSSLFPNTTTQPPKSFSHISTPPLDSPLPPNLAYITDKMDQKYRFSLLADVIHRTMVQKQHTKHYPAIEAYVSFSNLFHCPDLSGCDRVKMSVSRPACSVLSAAFSEKFECSQSCEEERKFLPETVALDERKAMAHGSYSTENFTLVEQFQKHFSPLRWNKTTVGARTKYAVDPINGFHLAVHNIQETMAFRHGVDFEECGLRPKGDGLKGKRVGEEGEGRMRGRGRDEGFEESELRKIWAEGRLAGPQFAMQYGRFREGGEGEWGEKAFGDWEKATKGEKERGVEVLMMLGGGVDVRQGCAGFVRKEKLIVEEEDAVMRHFHPMSSAERGECTVMDFDFLNTYVHHLFTAMEKNQDFEKVEKMAKKLEKKKN